MNRYNIHPLFKRLLLFIAIGLMINGAMTLYFYKVSIANHKLLKQDRVFHKSSKNIDFLIMGHSRPFKAIDVNILDKSVNFCSGGESSVHSYYKLKYALESSGKDIKTVILPAGFPSFNLPNPNINSNSFYWKRYVDYYELAKKTGNYTDYTSVWLKSHIIPWYEYGYLKVASITGDFRLGINKDDFFNGNENERLEIAKTIINQTIGTRDFYDKVSLIYLRKTIELCQKHDCQLVYIKYPISSYYKLATESIIEDYDLSKGMLEADSIIRANSDVEYWNYENYWKDSIQFFGDPQHLNSKGQKTFTKLLKNRFEEL